MTKNVIWYEPLFEDVQLPSYATEESAGMDVRAYIANAETVLVFDSKNRPVPQDPVQHVMIPAWGRAAIPLGFKARLPYGWECQVRSRSGLSLKQGLVVANAPGTIDSDFPGEWAVILQNTSSDMCAVRHGDRIAQLVLAPVHSLNWQRGTVEQTTSRAGGFGSTGVSG